MVVALLCDGNSVPASLVGTIFALSSTVKRWSADGLAAALPNCSGNSSNTLSSCFIMDNFTVPYSL